MKTIYNQFLVVFIIIISLTSCKGQVLPLNTSMRDAPLNSYLKDLNNELGPYVGTYQATIDGNQITLYITKQDHTYFDLGDTKFYKDVLIIRYTIKNSSGILQSTQNENFTSMKEKNLIHSRGIRSNLDMIVFSYNGTNCDIGWGTIYLKKISDTQISWRYYAETVATSHDRCPPNVDKSTYLPEGENLIFTKL